MKSNKVIMNCTAIFLLTFLIVIGVVTISYKKIYKVTLNNKVIGYIQKKEDYNLAYNQIKKLNMTNNSMLISISHTPKIEVCFIRRNIKVNYNKFVEALNSKENYQCISVLPKANVKIAAGDNNLKFRRPIYGGITSRFGSRWGKNHDGIDIKGDVGDNIYSVNDGVVINADWSTGYGRLIKIQHANNIVTYYGHCSKILVEKGDKVKQGEIVGEIGMSGRTTGSHLHFEVRKDNIPLNPLKYID